MCYNCNHFHKNSLKLQDNLTYEYWWDTFLTTEQGLQDKNSGLELWDKGSELGFQDEGLGVLGTKVYGSVVSVKYNYII